MVLTLKGEYKTRDVWLNGKLLSPERSQKIRNHSPDGFAWGYGGSGASQLALGVLLEVTTEKNASITYMDFKDKIISQLPQTDFEVEIEI